MWPRRAPSLNRQMKCGSIAPFPCPYSPVSHGGTREWGQRNKRERWWAAPALCNRCRPEFLGLCPPQGRAPRRTVPRRSAQAGLRASLQAVNDKTVCLLPLHGKVGRHSQTFAPLKAICSFAGAGIALFAAAVKDPLPGHKRPSSRSSTLGVRRGYLPSPPLGLLAFSFSLSCPSSMTNSRSKQLTPF